MRLLDAVFSVFFVFLIFEWVYQFIRRNRQQNRSSLNWFQQIVNSISSLSGRSSNPPSQQASRASGVGIIARLTGQYLDATQCEVRWSHDNELQTVGRTTVATVKFRNGNGNPYRLQDSDIFVCRIKHIATSTEISHVVEPLPFSGHEEVKVSFTARLSGDYSIAFNTSSGPIAGFPQNRIYLPGEIDSAKTVFLRFHSTIVLKAGFYHSIAIEPKDNYGNPAAIDQSKLDIEIRKNSPEGPLVNPEFFADRDASSKYELYLKVEEAGYYMGHVKYNNQIIGPQWFGIISLTEDDMVKVNQFVKARSHNLWFETKLIRGNQEDNKIVYCYISPKQLQIREYMFVYIPKRRIYTTRVCPLTKFVFGEGYKFTIDDGYQLPITLSSKDRQLIAATFSKYILSSIGGSEKFQDKQKYFYNEVRKQRKSTRKEQVIKVRRNYILHDTIKAVQSYTFDDWSNKFVIEFRGEEGKSPKWITLTNFGNPSIIIG